MASGSSTRRRSLVFPSEHALIAALGAGLVPADVAAQPTRFARRDDGAIEVHPDARLAEPVVAVLEQVGVDTATPADDLAAAPCWPAVIAPRPLARGADDATDRVALFWVEREQDLIELLGELIRLGCDRAAFQLFDGDGAGDGAGRPGALVRAYAPPYYTVSATADVAGRRVFAPAPPDQDQVWVEIGYEHPLITRARIAPGSIALVRGDGVWHLLSDIGWRDAMSIADVVVGGPARPHSAEPTATRLVIPLSLSRAAREQPPSLWLCGDRGEHLVERLVASVPDDVIGRLLYAVATRDGRREVILRARSGRGGPPAIELGDEPGGERARAFAPMSGVPNLYLPVGTGIEPPLRRDLLRGLLAADVERVFWLVPGDGERFSVDSIAESAFAPLADWVDYVVHSAAGQLEPWVRSAVFEFEAFRSTGGEWMTGPAMPSDLPVVPAAPAGRRRAARGRGRAVTDDEPVPAAVAPPTPIVAPTGELAPAIPVPVAPPPSEARIRLAEVERAFLDLDAPADSPERAAMWTEMAGLHQVLGQTRDAALCWTRAVWDAPAGAAAALTQAWASAESSGQAAPVAFARDRAPGREQMSRLVARCVAASAAGQPLPDDIAIGAAVRWLDQWDELLDVRSVWLGRAALARAAGNDALAIARARDRVLARLRNGLSIERDVPTFLRFVGGTGGDAVALEQLATELAGLHDTYRSTRRRRSPMEAPEERTSALVELEVAYGFAALGRSERARALRDRAIASLPATDPVYAFLCRAYAARIDQALEGQRRETSLPPALAAALGDLAKVDRFRIDRLRQASTILEPHERLNPFAGFHRAGDPHGEELAPLRGMVDPGELARHVGRLLRVALDPGTSVDDRARLADGLMDFFPRLAEADAVPALRAIAGGIGDVPPGRRALLLEEALMLAGFFDRDDVGRDIAARLASLVAELSPDEAAELASEFGRCLRSLRRVGLADRATSLLDQLSAATTGSGPRAVEARLHLAAGVAYLGGFAHAEPVIRAAQTGLADAGVSPSDRLRIARAVASAWSHAPRDAAIAGLRELLRLLPMISDSYTTNSHFCLSVVSFMDGLVLGLVTGDLAMGELGRRFLDQDEYLIRRRIHRELGAMG